MRAAVPKEVAETPQEERYDKIIVDRVLFPAHSHPQDREEIKGVHADAVPKEVAETFLEERCDKVIVFDRVARPTDSHPQDRKEIKGVHADAVPKEVAETFLEERCDKVIVSIESHVLPIATRRTAKRWEMQPVTRISSPRP